MASKKRPKRSKTTRRPTPAKSDAAVPVQAETESPDNSPSRGTPGPFIVSISASAGGLETFRKFFAAVPPDSGIAFVLAAHLNPPHESLMPEQIARFTTLPVVGAMEGMPVEANRVYVIPSNKYMDVSDGVFRLTGAIRRRGMPTSIEAEFRSAQEEMSTVNTVRDEQSREELERELEVRTAELAKINEQLHQEFVEHHQAEKSLRDSEARLRAVIDTAVDAIITIDENGLIRSTNPATAKMFGYSTSELIGQNVSTLMPSPYREEHDGYLMRYLQTGEKRIIGIGREVRGRRKDGTVFPVELAVSEMQADGGRFTGILHDITRRKELEREILEIADLEQKRIGQDLHDNVGQELTALGLLTDALLESIRVHSPMDLDVTRKISQGLKRSLARVRAISRGLIAAEVDVHGLRAALADLAARVGENPGVRCTFHCDEPFDIENHLKARHLLLIAQEACGNALKHSHAENIEIGLYLRDDLQVLQIKDDGIGIPSHPEEGLGLRIMRNRATVIQADLTIEPVEPHGTLVTCTLIKERPHEPRPRLA